MEQRKWLSPQLLVTLTDGEKVTLLDGSCEGWVTIEQAGYTLAFKPEDVDLLYSALGTAWRARGVRP